MSEQIIGIKELYLNLKVVSEKAMKGESFLVVKNSKPAFRIEPVENMCNQSFTLKDLKDAQFAGKDKDLSKRIDEIIYS